MSERNTVIHLADLKKISGEKFGVKNSTKLCVIASLLGSVAPVLVIF